MDTDLLMQGFQYLLGMIPGDVADTVWAIIATIVTISTLIIRFWKEPAQGSKIYKLWQIIHVLASFKGSTPYKLEKRADGKENT